LRLVEKDQIFRPQDPVNAGLTIGVLALHNQALASGTANPKFKDLS
jgi:hypothetical protein